MKIQIGGLSEGLHRYQFREQAATLELGEQFSEVVDIDAALQRNGRQLYLSAAVRATGSFLCDRCAAPFTFPLSITYQMYYVQDETDAGNLDPAEVQVIPPGLSSIDLAEDVRQMVLLAVPLKLLCRDNCRGLCTSCGADLNTGPCACPPEPVDTRWDALRGFTDEKSN
jgi:uncharacterized protein